MAARPRVALGPQGSGGWLREAIESGGADIVPTSDADALVWTDPHGPADLGALLDGEGRELRWVQLPWAGVEPYRDVIAAHADRVWTCGKGVYAEPVAEHALALLLAGLRGIGPYARERTWTGPQGTNLLHAPVVVVGGGGIAVSLLRLLEPFGCDTTIVRRTPSPMKGADRVVGIDDLDPALDGAVGVVLALALTPTTTGLMDRSRLERLHPAGWLVNVARGSHVRTDDLVAVLTEGRIGGAALDVTNPEPLPDSHPLWTLPNAIITPHVGNTPEMKTPLLSARVSENVRRWAAGAPLIGLVDPELGY